MYMLAGASALAFPALAHAQSGDNGIVVTGSRIITNGNNSPVPVTIVTSETLQTVKPTNLMDALNALPVFSGSRGQQSNPISSGIAGAGSPASNQLNLRNLGANRTLVLFDGQRVAPTTVANIVDADIIPQMLVQRVDMVTGGVSAVYGSDAVVGVVNFIPDKNFNGVKVQAQAGASGHGDNETWKAGIAAGMPIFDGKGHIEGSYEHYDNQGILSRWDRDWNNKWAVVGTGAQNNPYILVSNVRNNQSTFDGLITNGVLRDQHFATNGVLVPFVHGTATSTATAEIGGDGSYGDGSMVSPLRWDQVYFRGDYEFSESVRAHFQTSMNKKFNQQSTGWFNLNNVTVSSTNAFLPATYQQRLAAAGQTTFTFSERLAQVPQLRPDIHSDQYIANAGLEGEFAGYNWSLAANYGLSELRNTFNRNQSNERLAAALDAVVNPANGQIVCNTTLVNPGLRSDCVPINLFGPTSASQAAIDYVFPSTHFIAHNRMLDLNASISGQPFSTWAGPVGVALSAEWRRQTYSGRTDAAAAEAPNCTGLRFNCTANTTSWSEAFGTRSTVGVKVWEAAAEFDAPLVKDAPLIQELNISGATRYTNYSTKGAYWTWKAGLDWHLNDDVRVRGTASRDIRAPTLNDLYAPATIQPSNALDQLTNQQPQIRSFRAGNPDLSAEIGDTRTLGAVFKPTWLPGASLSVDAFYIKVDNAIVEAQGPSSALQQSCYASGGTSPYCTLQDRPLGNYTNTSAANTVTAWYQYNINIASVESYGADVEANYTGEIAGHRFALRTFVTWQPHILYTQPAVSNVDMAGVAYGPTPLIASPALRITATQSFNITDALRIDLTERRRSTLNLSGDSTLYVQCCEVPSTAYVDVNLSYKVPNIGQSAEAFFNVSNLFDKEPPGSAPPGSTTPGPMGGWALGDDPVGRAFLAGFRLRY
jgi:outer membrane receptor protein involved in Fe transport